MDSILGKEEKEENGWELTDRDQDEVYGFGSWGGNSILVLRKKACMRGCYF